MKVGVISDIHGNLPALEAVLTELGQERINTLLCAGDMVGTLGWSDAVCSLVRLSADKVVYGNHDANVMPRFQNGNQVLSMEYKIVTEGLSEENTEWLKQLPDKQEFMHGGYSTVLVHAHPNKKPHHGFPAQNYLSPRSYTQAGSNKESSVVIHGHTHDQHALKLDKFDGLNGLVLNPGSVGVPWHKPAEYAIYDATTLEYELRQVEDDTERNIEKVKELGLEGWREESPNHKL
jgi:putative phosphoesterase